MARHIEIPPDCLTCPPLQPFGPPPKLKITPQLEPRDEAALLLTVAAEIEHALMVQYLYAAYSVRYDQQVTAHQAAARDIHLGVLQIAREEMGHLMTVQNLLHLIGAPLNLEREHSPFESQLYPLRFKLERLSLHSLAKYVTAERPLSQPARFPDDDWHKLQEIERMAKRGNDGQPVQHVGPIFERLIELFTKGPDSLKDEDFRVNTIGLQATWDDWGYDESLEDGDDARRVLVETFEGTNPDSLRDMAIKTLSEIGDQGEGFGAEVDSHFERFFQIYMDFQDLNRQGVDFVWPVAANPNTLSQRPHVNCAADPISAIRNASVHKGCITNQRSRNWGHLFNFRYRLLLGMLSHFLHITGPRYIADGPDRGNRTPRGHLLLWTFDEMRHLRKIAQKLVQLPLRDPADGTNAGAPFELPYTLAIPSVETDRWRLHLDVVRSSHRLVAEELFVTGSPDEFDPFLKDLQEADERSIVILHSLAAGSGVPFEFQPTRFQKAAKILEEAVRGFTIQAHGNFWTGVDRDTFVDLHMFNSDLIGKDDDCQLTPNGGFLISQLLGRSSSKLAMPRYRPSVDRSRIQFLSGWIQQQAPDNKPPGESGAVHERTPNDEVRPTVAPTPGSAPVTAATGTLDFTHDIRPLFSDFDVESFREYDGIVLDSETSVKQNAQLIAERLEAGTIPYDGNWPPEAIELFSRWVQSVGKKKQRTETTTRSW